MRIKITVAATLLVIAALATGVVVASGGDARPPWENEDGIWDMSRLPATEEVVDHTGAVVGTVKTEHYLTDQYPLPVFGPDGQVVGQIGRKGYWASGESEPNAQGGFTVIKTFDESDEETSSQTISD